MASHLQTAVSMTSRTIRPRLSPLRSRHRLALAIALAGLIPASGCTDATEVGDGVAPGEEVRSDRDRNAMPAASEDTVEALARANREFAFDLYRQVKTAEAGNLLLSPYSISSVLAMTYAGARGETEQQMAATLHFELPQAELHDANNALSLALAERAEPVDLGGAITHGFHLQLTSSAWGQLGYSFVGDFLDTLALHYGAGMHLLDFGAEPEASRAAINDWVNEQTHQLIPELLGPEHVNSSTLLVLTDAIYFEAFWADRFDPAETVDGPFYRTDGTEVRAPIMHDSVTAHGVIADDYTAVSLRYEGFELSMVIIVPDAGAFAAVEAGLSADWFDTVHGSLSEVTLTLSMPRFAYESAVDLKEALSAMGMPVAFTSDADFSGMTGDRSLVLADVVHKTTISVDENGTIASGASAAVGAVSDPPPMTLDVNRPFVYAVRDNATGALLFLGRVTDPS